MVLRAFSWICSQRSLSVDLGNNMGSLYHMQSKFPTHCPSFLASFFFLGFTFWTTQACSVLISSSILLDHSAHAQGTTCYWNLGRLYAKCLVCLSDLSLHFQSFLLFYAPS